MPKLLIILTVLLLHNVNVLAQKVDSTLESLKQIPTKYLADVDKKINQYTSRVTGKTEKTLTKLSRWENKIKSLLEKTSPETATRLFGNNQLTFTSLLEKVKQGEALALQYKAPYDKYRDDLTTGLKYLADQKKQLDSGLLKKATATAGKMQELDDAEDRSEAIQQFIKERKKELIAQSIQYIGKSKYLTKINKEAYYYAETLKNYKALFSDSKKAEQTAKAILSKIPAFNEFLKKNSMLSGLFEVPSQNAQIVPGMQTRNSVEQLIQSRLISMGSNGQDLMSKNLQSAQAKLNDYKSKLAKGSSGDAGLDFKPNNQKAKIFRERLEYSTNIQFSKSTNIFPSGSDIAMSIGYKLNDRSIIGLGASYMLGIGDIKNIKLSTQGVGLRSFVDWKLKKQFFISGGFEMNYKTWNEIHSQVTPLQDYEKDGTWQQSALIGITKKLSIKTKWFKSTNVQLLYDLLSAQHIPISQPVVFRMGYSF